MLSFHQLVSAKNLSREDVDRILAKAKEMEEVVRQGGNDQLKGKILASLFYEPSTRTRLSFESAMYRLGGSVITVNGTENSSLKKGESLEDTIKMITSYADIIVMRHAEAGSAQRAAAVASVPFINAGDGGNQHPTQGLVDLYTVLKERGTLENLHIAVACDPRQSRTIRTFIQLLSLFSGNHFTLISPESLRASKDLTDAMEANGATYTETTELAAGLAADVLYMNRFQEERFANHEEFERIRHSYVLTADMVRGRSVTIIDPLPRIDQIASDVDDLPQAAYFRQAANAVPVRMALLSLLLP